MAYTLSRMSQPLCDAIALAKETQLRSVLQQVCIANEEARRLVSKSLLTNFITNEDGSRIDAMVQDPECDRDYDPENPGSSESEDDDEDDDEDEDEDEDDEGDDDSSTNVGPSVVAAAQHRPALQETTGNVQSRKRKLECPRYYTCDQCNQEFSLDSNDNKQCVYHPGESFLQDEHLQHLTIKGEREVNYDADIWADHDEDCHGPYEDHEEDYPEGFSWTCCEREGDKSGCKRGPHRAIEFEHRIKIPWSGGRVHVGTLLN